jgi:tetratricopeptide (TPR) repeat protein
LARTLSSFDEETGRLVDADILLNAEFHDWSDPMRIDPVSVLVHELGHVLGLQHFNGALDTVMAVHPYPSGVRLRKLGRYETLAVRRLYGWEIERRATDDAELKWMDAAMGGDWKEAIPLLASLPSSTAGLAFGRGFVALQAGDALGSLSAFEKATQDHPVDPRPRYQWATALLRLGKPEAATEQLLRILRDHPRHYEALADLGALELEKGNRARAREWFEKALQVNPIHYPVCELLFELTKKKHYRDCVQKFGPGA